MLEKKDKLHGALRWLLFLQHWPRPFPFFLFGFLSFHQSNCCRLLTDYWLPVSSMIFSPINFFHNSLFPIWIKQNTSTFYVVYRVQVGILGRRHCRRYLTCLTVLLQGWIDSWTALLFMGNINVEQSSSYNLTPNTLLSQRAGSTIRHGTKTELQQRLLCAQTQSFSFLLEINFTHYYCTVNSPINK